MSSSCSQQVGLQADTHRTQYATFKCHEQYAAQNHNINMANKSIENILECFLILC